MEIYLLGVLIAFIISVVSKIVCAYNEHSDIYVSDIFKCFCIALWSWGLLALSLLVIIIATGHKLGELPVWRWKGK